MAIINIRVEVDYSKYTGNADILYSYNMSQYPNMRVDLFTDENLSIPFGSIAVDPIEGWNPWDMSYDEMTKILYYRYTMYTGSEGSNPPPEELYGLAYIDDSFIFPDSSGNPCENIPIDPNPALYHFITPSIKINIDKHLGVITPNILVHPPEKTTTPYNFVDICSNNGNIFIFDNTYKVIWKLYNSELSLFYGTPFSNEFGTVTSIVCDYDNIYIADYTNFCIHKIDTTTKVRTILVSGLDSYIGGSGASINERRPISMCINWNKLYVYRKQDILNIATDSGSIITHYSGPLIYTNNTHAHQIAYGGRSNDIANYNRYFVVNAGTKQFCEYDENLIVKKTYPSINNVAAVYSNTSYLYIQTLDKIILYDPNLDIQLGSLDITTENIKALCFTGDNNSYNVIALDNNTIRYLDFTPFGATPLTSSETYSATFNISRKGISEHYEITVEANKYGYVTSIDRLSVDHFQVNFIVPKGMSDFYIKYFTIHARSLDNGIDKSTQNDLHFNYYCIYDFKGFYLKTSNNLTPSGTVTCTLLNNLQSQDFLDSDDITWQVFGDATFNTTLDPWTIELHGNATINTNPLVFCTLHYRNINDNRCRSTYKLSVSAGGVDHIAKNYDMVDNVSENHDFTYSQYSFLMYLFGGERVRSAFNCSNISIKSLIDLSVIKTSSTINFFVPTTITPGIYIVSLTSNSNYNGYMYTDNTPLLKYSLYDVDHIRAEINNGVFTQEFINSNNYRVFLCSLLPKQSTHIKLFPPKANVYNYVSIRNNVPQLTIHDDLYIPNHPNFSLNTFKYNSNDFYIYNDLDVQLTDTHSFYLYFSNNSQNDSVSIEIYDDSPKYFLVDREVNVNAPGLPNTIYNWSITGGVIVSQNTRQAVIKGTAEGTPCILTLNVTHDGATYTLTNIYNVYADCPLLTLGYQAFYLLYNASSTYHLYLGQPCAKFKINLIGGQQYRFNCANSGTYTPIYIYDNNNTLIASGNCNYWGSGYFTFTPSTTGLYYIYLVPSDLVLSNMNVRVYI